jgi:hypothetical protein
MVNSDRFDVALDSPALAYLRDHVVDGRHICPGTVYLESAAEAAQMLLDGAAPKLELLLHSISFVRALVLHQR